MVSLSHSRAWQRLAAAAAGTAIALSAIGPVAAQDTHYADVEAGVWYEEAAAALLESGALDESEVRLRPNDLATRAEVLKLLVSVYGEELVYPATPSFTDVPRSAWYYPYVEASARAGWVKGDMDCYGTGTRPCTARPGDRVNRAEMATLLQRAFRIAYLNLAPDFSDNARGMWYYNPIQTAADHCILEGDDGTRRVRPAASMNRAEMVVMFHRASMGMRYGDDCGQADGRISSASAASADEIEVTFNVDLDANRMDDSEYYSVEVVGGSSVDVDGIAVENARTIRIQLGDMLEDGEEYRVMVDGMRTDLGNFFDGSRTFTFHSDDVMEEASIESVTIRDSNTIRVTFDSDVEASFADDAARYMLERTSNGAEIDIDSVTVVNARSADVNLATDLVMGATYLLRVENMRETDQDEFSDSMTFSSSLTGDASLLTVSVVSSTRLRLTFSHDLDEDRAEDEIRYRVSGTDGDVGIASVGLVDDHVVEIILDDALVSQESYTATVTNVLTTGGVTFTDDASFVYAQSNVSFTSNLNGTNEVPLVVTTATGTGSFTLTSAGLQYDITLRNLSGSVITGAHFHRGDVGVNGPVLEPISFNTTTLRATGTWTDLTAEERSLLLAGDVYVNVHTVARPDGEIRGQVIR